MKYLFLLALCTACSGGVPKEACEPVALSVIETANKLAVGKVIDAGKCDDYQDVTECPAYKEVNAKFDVAYTGWKLCR